MNGQKFPQKAFPEEWKPYSCKVGINSTLMSMYLEFDVMTVPVGVMVRCPNTFIHIVCQKQLPKKKKRNFLYAF